MIYVTKDEIGRRWDTLPESLKEKIVAETTSDFVWKTCAEEHIPEDKIYTVMRIVGHVLLGFLHPGDLGPELADAAGINKQVAAAIAGPISTRIFDPMKEELDKVYEPPSKFEENIGPKIIQDIGFAAQIASQTAMAAPAAGTTPIAANHQPLAAAPPAAPKPKLPDVGWSRTTPEEPVVKLSQMSTPLSSQTGPGAPPPAPAKQAQMPIKGPIGEFERIAIQGGQRTVPAAAAGEPGPVIIHEDAVSKPQQTTPDFRIQMPTEKFDSSKAAPPVKAAVLELGKATPPPAQNPPNISTRVVHYSEYKAPAAAAPAPKMPPAQQGQRQITEITSAPKPAAPPTPPGKIVYKDYTAPQPPKAPPMLPQK